MLSGPSDAPQQQDHALVSAQDLSKEIRLFVDRLRIFVASDVFHDVMKSGIPAAEKDDFWKGPAGEKLRAAIEWGKEQPSFRARDGNFVQASIPFPDLLVTEIKSSYQRLADHLESIVAKARIAECVVDARLDETTKSLVIGLRTPINAAWSAALKKTLTLDASDDRLTIHAGGPGHEVLLATFGAECGLRPPVRLITQSAAFATVPARARLRSFMEAACKLQSAIPEIDESEIIHSPTQCSYIRGYEQGEVAVRFFGGHIDNARVDDSGPRNSELHFRSPAGISILGSFKSLTDAAVLDLICQISKQAIPLQLAIDESQLRENTLPSWYGQISRLILSETLRVLTDQFPGKRDERHVFVAMRHAFYVDDIGKDDTIADLIILDRSGNYLGVGEFSRRYLCFFAKPIARESYLELSERISNELGRPRSGTDAVQDLARALKDQGIEVDGVVLSELCAPIGAAKPHFPFSFSIKDRVIGTLLNPHARVSFTESGVSITKPHQIVTQLGPLLGTFLAKAGDESYTCEIHNPFVARDLYEHCAGEFFPTPDFWKIKGI